MLMPEQIERAKKWRRENPPLDWETIGLRLGCSSFIVHTTLDPDYLRRRRVLNKINKRVRAGLPIRDLLHKGPGPVGQTNHTESGFRAPPEVLADRDRRAMLVPASVTAALMGDPAPGRSALDKRRGV